jgi:uncharacterized protein YjbI with pentapeptide repeats
LATEDDTPLADEGLYHDVLFERLDFSRQAAVNCSFEQVAFRDVSLAGSELGDLRLTDVVFERCDFAGAVWTDASLLRVRFVGCRLSAFAINRSALVDVVVTGSRGDCCSLFESEGRRWLFEDSQLAELDCRGLRLEHARFDGCDLTRAQWGHARLDDVAFVRCDLAGLGGVGGLGGSSVDTSTLLTMAPAIARHLGMSVVDEPTG